MIRRLLSDVRIPMAIILGVMCSVMIVGSLPADTFAAVWSGRGPATKGGTGGHAYFSNASGCVGTSSSCSPRTSDNHVLPESTGGLAIPTSITGSTGPAKLVALLKKYNKDSGTRKKTGSAFLVHSMLGRSGSQANSHGGRTIKDQPASIVDDYDTLLARLNDRQAAGKINWNKYVCKSPTTFTIYRNRVADVMRDSNGQCGKAIVITNRNGSQYIIMRKCANPVGTMSAINQPLSDYDLTPTIDGDKETSEGKATVTLAPTMNNAGTTSSASALWQVTGFVVPSGGNVPDGDTNTTVPLTYFGVGNSNVRTVKSSSNAFAKGLTSGSAFPMTTAERTVDLGDYDVGDRVCFALSVRKYTETATDADWRHSTPYCVVVTKKPKVQILGNDLFVGKGETSSITTSTTIKTVDGKSRTYGSWGEYGLIASGSITGMASGAGYSGGAGDTTYCNLLSFTNEDAPRCGDGGDTEKGGYSSINALPSIGSQFIVNKPSLGNSPTFTVENLSKGIYTATGNVTINSNDTIAKGKWIVLNMPDANVRIGNNIEYSSATLNSLSDIPQLIIIANSISIDGDVGRIDAWLIAQGDSGTIDTCREVVDWEDLDAGKCNKKLTVNGPVIADHLVMQRTAGSDVDDEKGDPAEVFNLRPDAYLWATAWSADAGRLQTVFSKELPPRF